MKKSTILHKTAGISKNNKLLITLFLIGLLGGYISTLFRSPKPVIESEQKIPETESVKPLRDNKISPNYIETNSKIFPSSLKISENAIFTINYANRSDSDLKNITLTMISPQKSGISFAAHDNVRFDQKATDMEYETVFDLPDVKKGKTKYVSVSVYADNPGSYIIYSQIRSGSKKGISVQPFQITFN